MGYVHRDIKLENILFSQSLEPKIGDLGFVEEMALGQLSKTHKGTCGYQAPELVTAKTTINSMELPSCDIFSLGVTFFAVLIGFMPFPSVGLRFN
jgi:serine/threonine protein kinase